MHIDVLSLFPDYIKGPLGESILKRAIQKGLISVENHDIRDFSDRKDRRVDDRPYGGGPGMVLSPEPVKRAIHAVRRGDSKVVYLSPRGVPFSASLAKELSQETHLVLLCGHYEGIDERVLKKEVALEISIGDYVLTNGCLAALVVIDALSRFIPGVMGDESSSLQDSFEEGLLECPHYSHVINFEGEEVPDILLSGHHAHIRQWRQSQAFMTTLEKRPDLLTKDSLSDGLQAGITVGCSSLQEISDWYKTMLGVEIEIGVGMVCFTYGTIRFTFYEGKPVTEIDSLWSFLLNPERFETAVKYGYKKQKRRMSSDVRRAFFRDPDGRRIELIRFIEL
jgi:tRNA (guanine37-N1)-methyltransferase